MDTHCSNVLGKVYGLQSIIRNEDRLSVEYGVKSIELYARVWSVVRWSTCYEDVILSDVKRVHPLEEDGRQGEIALDMSRELMRCLARELGLL